MTDATATDWVNDTHGQVIRNQSAEFIVRPQIQRPASFGFGKWVVLPDDAVVESGYIVGSFDQDNN